MQNIIKNRVEQESNLFIDTEMTIRELALKLNRSKSTIHKDLTERLYYIDRKKYYLIQKIFKKHLDIRHIKGGNSTKQKYSKNTHKNSFLVE